MPKTVGLLVGREWSFPPAFIEEVNRRDAGVTVEYAKIGAAAMDEPCPYDVLIDRISHEVPFYRTYLKKAVLEGVTVVNNPFMWTRRRQVLRRHPRHQARRGASQDRRAARTRTTSPASCRARACATSSIPLDWEGIVDYVGLPCILKDAHGGGWKEVYVCRSLEELIHHYDHSGLLTMIVQEFIEWDQFVRCICLGQEEVLPMQYDPRERRYLVRARATSRPELEARDRRRTRARWCGRWATT